MESLPPEGVEWHNRWAELENACARLEQQKSALEKEVSELKGALHEKLQEPVRTTVDEELQQQKEQLQQQVDGLLSEEVRKEEKIARLLKELELQTGKMSELSKAKYQLEYEKSRTESELLPLTVAREHLQQEKEMKDQTIAALRKELASSREEQEKLFRERFEMTRELRRELQAAKAETSYQQQVAEEAVQAQYRERKLKEDLEQKVKDLQEDFAKQKAILEDEKRISQSKAERVDGHWKQAQAQLAETVEDLTSTCQAREELANEMEELKTELQELRQKYQSLSQQHEDFLRRRVPGAATGELPSGFESMTELVRIAQSSREEALQERAAKENLQQVLQDIEREIRQRYPILMSQNQELRELRAQNSELKEQNKIIYQKAREYATYNRDAEARAQRCEHSQKIIEGHAQDLTKQLAVLLYEKNRRSNVNLAASRLTWLQLTQAEDEEWPLNSVQEVVEQNVALRKALRQLEATCQEEEQKDKEIREDREQQLEDELEKKSEELTELTNQLQEVKDALEDVSSHRDAALRKVKSLEAATASPPGASLAGAGKDLQAPVPEAKPSQREEELRSKVMELQSAATEAARSLATSQATLEFEQQRRRDVEESSKQTARELKELQERFGQQAKFIEDLREEKCIQESKLREATHALKSAQTSQGEADAALKTEQLKVSELEQRVARVATEKQVLEREVSALQSRISQERESLKKDLEEQYKKQEELFTTLSKKGQDDITRLEAALKETRDKEASEAAKRFDEQSAKLEAKLAATLRENAELRLGAGPGARVVAEVQGELEKSEPILRGVASDSGDVRRLLQQATEREEQHQKTVETWKSLLAQQSSDLRNSKTEQERLEQELQDLKAQLSAERGKLEEAAQRDKAKAVELSVQLDESRSQVLGLRSQLEASSLELESAKLDWEQKMRDTTEEVNRLEREKQELQEEAQKAEQKYQEEVKLHASDAKELGSAHERLTELDRSCLQLKHQVKDLERETGRAREERKEELSSVRKRMEQAERHAEFLSEENSRYRDQIVALSRSPGEESQQVLAEMKKAREIGELERRRLELQKTQVEEDVRALRAENQSLREQLANQQSENWRLQKDCQLETQSRAKLLQIDMIEDENCRLEADNKSMKQKLEEAEKRANATTNPYVKQLEDEKKRTQELEKEAKSQKGQAEEWKSMYEACKFKEEDIKRWEAQQAELKSKVTSLEELISGEVGGRAESLQGRAEQSPRVDQGS
ncbi:Hypothetical protein (Fragment) [Durusdinium trenchii]|uniref:Nucleoprotein TPR n=1 Tax=Durusdinium trenchii TaxID=1381693 RepID=A0ABP0JGC0_9DINO